MMLLTERPIARQHVGEVRDDIEGGVDDVSHGEIDQEVIRHRPHPSIGHHDPDH